MVTHATTDALDTTPLTPAEEAACERWLQMVGVVLPELFVPEPPALEVRCAWCSSLITAGVEGGLVSHGICVSCSDTQLAALRFAQKQDA